jgi:ABC-type spermidine/putrescine transport system permease subunit I
MTTEATAARKRPKAWLHWLNILPMSLWMLIFFIVPMIILSVYSVWSVENFRLQREFTLGNYGAIFTEPLLYKAFSLSLRVAFFASFGAIALAYPFAFFLAKKVKRFQTLALLAVIVPFWTSYILRAYAWRILLGPNGAINKGLELAGVIDEPIKALLYSPTATGIGLLYVYLPLAILPIYSVLERLPDSLSEAAANLGASPWKTFREVILPLSMPGVLVGGVFTFVFGIGEYVIPALLGGGKQLLYAEAIVLRINAQQDWPAAAAMSIVLMALTVGMVALLGRRVRRLGMF